VEDRAAYDELAEAYSRTFDPDGTGLRDPVFERLLGDVTAQRVLALACGQGQDARLLASLGAQVVGVDLSERMLAHARERERKVPRGIRYVQGDAEELSDFADESFDGVACHMALMDIARLEPTIVSTARVLRAGGWFVLSIVHPCYRPHVEIVSDYLSDVRYERKLSKGGPSRSRVSPSGRRVREYARAHRLHDRRAGRGAPRCRRGGLGRPRTALFTLCEAAGAVAAASPRWDSWPPSSPGSAGAS